MNTKLVLALKIVAVFIVVPYLLSQVTLFVLERVNPSPPAAVADKTAARTMDQRRPMSERLKEMEREAAVAKANLAAVRAKTRLTLIVIAVYYIVAAAAWIVLWRRKRARLQPAPQP